MIWQILNMQAPLRAHNTRKDWKMIVFAIFKYHISKPCILRMLEKQVWFTESVTAKNNLQKNIFYTTDNLAYFFRLS